MVSALAPAGSVGRRKRRPGGWRPALRRFIGHRLFVVGAVLCAAALALALFADLIATADPVRIRMREAFQAPSAAHWLGTDSLGRDVYSRVVYGARLSLAIGMATVLLAGVLGSAFGVLSGYYRNWDDPIMRFMDALMAFPPLLLALAITAALGPSATNVVIAISVPYVPRIARLVRASALTIRELDFVSAAKAIGAGDMRIVLRHVLPNCLAPLVVQLTFVFAYAVLNEAALSFIGLGPPPPAPSWGNIITDGRDYLREAWWICLFPGIAISITVLGLNLLGDGLRDLIDPRLKVEQ
jgi:peptide/nickel transport system permease protein